MLRFFFVMFGIISKHRCFTSVESRSAVVGSTVELKCPYNGTKNNFISWFTKGKQLSFALDINGYLLRDLRQRLSITGDHTAGEFHLTISGVTKNDEGEYECGQTISSVPSKHQLIVIVGPTSVNIANKIPGDKVQGTENQNITIRCIVVGGNPAPDMTLQIGNDEYKGNSKHTIQHTIQGINRSFDAVNVTCQAGYQDIPFTPLVDTAEIILNLKPLQPTFSLDSIDTENIKTLAITCTSTGSRPAPTERIWMIGDSNVDITSSSTSVSSSLQYDGTFIVTSTLTYKVNKIYDKQNVSCGFRNTASVPTFIQNSKRMNVHYAPDVSVPNRTFHLTQTLREIKCDVDGKPSSTFFRWQHKSKTGELIRELDGNSTLILPQQSEEIRYQDTGEYECTVSNGIRDEEGNVNQRGSGYIFSQAPPRFVNGSDQVKYGQLGKNISITISVYSEPKYSTPTWLRDDNVLTLSSKYAISEVADVTTDIYYGTKINIECFRMTLTIMNLVEQDFANYTLGLNNGVGGTVEHLVILLPSFPPDVPYNFTATDVTESTITLKWIPAFDGGHKQTFIIQYRAKDLYEWKEAAVPIIDEVLPNGLHLFELVGLESGTLYEIRIYAENIFDRSPASSIENISTRCTCKYCNVESCRVTDVAVGLSTVTVISLIINGVCLYRILRGNTMAMAIKGNSSPQVYYNTTEINDTEDMDIEINESKYETLGTKEKPNEYEDFNQTPKDDNIEMASCNYEMLGRKDKPNVYEDLNNK